MVLLCRLRRRTLAIARYHMVLICQLSGASPSDVADIRPLHSVLLLAEQAAPHPLHGASLLSKEVKPRSSLCALLLSDEADLRTLQGALQPNMQCHWAGWMHHLQRSPTRLDAVSAALRSWAGCIRGSKQH